MRMNHNQRLVLAHVRATDEGCTDDEIALQLYLHPDTARPRRYELVQRGYLKDSGRRRACPGGRTGVVWMATETGDDE